VEAVLRSGAESLGLALTDRQVAQLLDYAALLQKWAKVYNLTALRDPAEIATHHLLDSLAVVAPLRRMFDPPPARLLDVGSGAGLPGVVIAVMCPGVQVDCVDAVAKKMAFVQQVAGSLGLANLRGIHSRIEDLKGAWPVVTSRAFSSLADFVRRTDHVLGAGGSWMAMKGKFPADELAALPAGVEMFHVEQLQVPGLEAERCLVWLRREAA
jgi:16S rRNA (guanine527-N7)-methyltransferase